MNDFPLTATPMRTLDKENLVVTSKLFDAYLACPTKCYLQSIGEVAARNDFTIRAAARSESYRLNGVQRLMADHPQDIGINLADAVHWKRESWHFAIAPIVRAQNTQATFHAVQRVQPGRTTKSTAFVPVRFVPENKLFTSDKRMAAFDALVLSRALGAKTGTAMIIYGDKSSVFNVKANVLSRVVHRTIGQVAALISARSPPDLILNRQRGRRKTRLLSRTVHDLVFGRDSIKRRVVRYEFRSYRCRSCAHEYGLNEWYLHARKWGWNVVAYFIYHIIGLRVPQRTMLRSLNRVFGFDVGRSTLNNLKSKAADGYLVTKRKLLKRIVQGNLVHADETRANIKGHLACVWVLTNLKEVVYILAESREAEIVQELLKGFKGVLVTDFYAAYESIACPQQKCLIHLMRDLNDEILNNPFDKEMKSIAIGFAGLLKPMVETIDRFGLKKRSLRKHLVEVDRFYAFLDASDFESEAASKSKQRFSKNRDTLFTFLRYDGIPWNNNNAEHAIKAFARLRDVIAGSSTKKGIDEYLTLLSVAETCEYQGLDFLDFLQSGEKDIETFVRGRRRYHRHKEDKLPPQRPRRESSPVGNDAPAASKLVDLPDDVA